LRTQLFKKVFDQKNNTHDSSENTKFAKQPNVEIFPKIGKTNSLSKPVTSNSISTPQEPKRVNNDKDAISKVVCVVCKKCLNSVNHDVCLNNCVNGKKSRGRKHKANVSKNETQQKNQPDIKKPKKVGFIKRLATPKPRKPRFLLRWSPTGKMFNLTGKLVAPSNSESHVDCSNGDNVCISNAMEPKIKWFPNSTSLLGRLSRFVCGLSKFKYHKEHLCPSCEQGKSKRASYPPKPVPNSRQRLHLLHMDLCGPMRIASINGKRKPDISFLHVFGALYYPKNDYEDIGKLGAKGDIGFFIRYSADSCAYRIYKRRTKKIMETMNVSFDELSVMAFEQRSSKPG
nr:integrase, catalytic region, zinc finger, CCHC-type, peptidase aspartic, catalytic [Tanacetum cinerariifolium]